MKARMWKRCIPEAFLLTETTGDGAVARDAVRAAHGMSCGISG